MTVKRSKETNTQNHTNDRVIHQHSTSFSHIHTWSPVERIFPQVCGNAADRRTICSVTVFLPAGRTPALRLSVLTHTASHNLTAQSVCVTAPRYTSSTSHLISTQLNTLSREKTKLNTLNHKAQTS